MVTVPNVVDRLIQQAILQVLTPIFDPGFSESSFGFRPGRSAHEAAKQVQSCIRAGYRHCVDMDMSGVFSKTKEAARRVFASIERYLTRITKPTRMV